MQGQRDKNKDLLKSKGEQEEDLLKWVYQMWRQGRQVTIKDYKREKNISIAKTARLVGELSKKGLLEELQKEQCLLLTEKGKLAGLDCLARHEKLTQFFQMISGMDQEQAGEDACRAEHYISPEGLKGIENFLLFGDVYDRVYDGMDFYGSYKEGEFPMAFGLYEPERRNPRCLTGEYEKLENSALLRVDCSQRFFCLRPKEKQDIGFLWYRRGEEWIEAKKEEGEYRLPADIFRYTANAGIPITEAVAIIGITRFCQKPLAMDYRELNIHIW